MLTAIMSTALNLKKGVHFEEAYDGKQALDLVK
jgi:hypothetical protein